MTDFNPRHVTFRSWSGIGVRGANKFREGRSLIAHKAASTDSVLEWDVVLSAIAGPEGAAYDPVTTYDGTAVTWGLAQWTMTSGRLQKLLCRIQKELPTEWNRSPVPSLLTSLGLSLDPDRKLLLNARGYAVVDKDKLRDVFTPPAGQVPKRGWQYERAVSVAKAFFDLGQDAAVAELQERFLLEELASEARFSRPKLGGKSLAFYLYQKWPGAGDAIQGPELTAARAMVWSFWQNGPREAERHLKLALGNKPFSALSDLDRIAKVYARSTFGFWGNAKCGKTRESRYHKIASILDRLIGDKLQVKLDLNLK